MLTHFNKDGRSQMVDISEKVPSSRKAIASSQVRFSKELYKIIQQNGLKKGDPLQVAQISGIMAAKKTSDIIPMCHPILLQKVNLNFHYEEQSKEVVLYISAEVTCSGQTGVEMEALTAASVAALTFYDMCKAVDKGMVIEQTQLQMKSGGKNGNFTR